MMTFQTLHIEKNNNVLTIFLNRPEKRNALNALMCHELRTALAAIDHDETVSMLLIRSKGSVFCAGADLAERKTMSPNDVRARRLIAFAAYDAIEKLSKPSISILEGAAIGSGAEIATACDFAIGTENSSFRYPEVGWGTIGATQRLPEIVGRRHAKNLLFTGREVGAHEALALGLISQLIQSKDLEVQLAELTKKIAQAPAIAIKSTKKCVDEATGIRRQAALGTELLAIENLMMGEQWKGNIQDF